MEKSIRNITKKLISWLQADNSANQSDSIKILALFKLIMLIDKNLDTAEKAFIQNFIAKDNSYNYSKESLFNCILANSLLLETGSISQIEAVLEYSAILYEIKDASPDSLNGALLNGVFNDEDKNEICKLAIKVPLFDLDIIKMIHSVVGQIEMKSRFGTCEVQYDPVFNNKIEGMAIHAIRQYDLELSMRCLRALKYLKCKESLAMDTGLDFLIHQQCGDGTFGDFDTAFSEVKNQADYEKTVYRIKLETAIQVVWTLYELTNEKSTVIGGLCKSSANFNQIKN